MKQFKTIFLLLFLLSCSGADKPRNSKREFTGTEGEVKLIVLAPGHFHADLLQKNKLDQINDTVFVYAPKGDELQQHLIRIQSFNTRKESPTQWQEDVYVGDDFLDKMIADKKGNVVVLAGNNRDKSKYIYESIAAGLHVLSDKPMAISRDDFELLKSSYELARANDLILYDMMTERYDVLNIVEQKLINNKELFGEIENGTETNPGIAMESVHHFYKEVADQPLIRPAWYYDVEQQGEGIADVTTHLIDLAHWKCFPEQVIDYEKEVQVVSATRWPTKLTLSEFTKSTNKATFPDFLDKYIKSNKLEVNANGTIHYQIKGVNVALKVIWNYSAPEGGGDTFSSTIRGSKAIMRTIQNEKTGFIKELHVEKTATMGKEEFNINLQKAIEGIDKNLFSIEVEPSSINKDGFLIAVSKKENREHESHFQYMTANFLNYLVNQNLPDWEFSNTLAKYHIITAAVDMAKDIE